MKKLHKTPSTKKQGRQRRERERDLTTFFSAKSESLINKRQKTIPGVEERASQTQRSQEGGREEEVRGTTEEDARKRRRKEDEGRKGGDGEDTGRRQSGVRERMGKGNTKEEEGSQRGREEDEINVEELKMRGCREEAERRKTENG